MKQLLICIILILCGLLQAFGQEMYDYNVYISDSGDSLRYRSLEPQEIQKRKKYPLVVFLHGSGQRGSDNEKQLGSFSKILLNPVNRKKYPAFAIFPQCPKGEWWVYDRKPEDFDTLPYAEGMNLPLTMVRDIIEEYLRMPQVDRSRVYIIGFSMGGVGTYDLVSRHPEMFAAAVPLCGAIAPGHLGNAKKVSFRIFHGDKDPTVPVECSRRAHKELSRAGAYVEYVEIPGGKHGISTQVYNKPDFMEWLFQQKKRK